MRRRSFLCLSPRPTSELVRGWLAEDEHIVTWVWTCTEITGAIERRTREGSILRLQRREFLERLRVVAGRWDEVTEVLAVRARVDALLARHALRAAGAGQLGAALLVQEHLGGPLTLSGGIGGYRRPRIWRGCGRKCCC